MSDQSSIYEDRSRYSSMAHRNHTQPQTGEIVNTRFKLKRAHIGETPQMNIQNHNTANDNRQDEDHLNNGVAMRHSSSRSDQNRLSTQVTNRDSNRYSIYSLAKSNEDFETDQRRLSNLTNQTAYSHRLSQTPLTANNEQFMDTYSVTPTMVVTSQPRQRPYGLYSTPGDDNELKPMEDIRVSLGFNILSIITSLFLLGDSVIDWYVTIMFDNYACGANQVLNMKFYKFEICNVHRETIRQALVIFSMGGSILNLMQLVDICLRMMKRKGWSRFKLFRPLTEVYIAIFLAEIPQCATLLVFMYNCDCSSPSRLLSVGMISSSLVSTLLRYTISFPGLAGNSGCCNSWWRCCCCREKTVLCRMSGRDCFCRCSIPCPLFCCTLECDNCGWVASTWMGSLCKALGCGCDCCRLDKDSYGIQLMNNLGVLGLFLCLVAGLVMVGVHGWT